MKRPQKISALVLGVFYLVFGSALALADSHPYFRAYGADSASGGWFNSGASSCSPAAAGFQAPTYSSATNLDEGGILAYAKSDGSGAGSQYGALSLGLIDGSNNAGEIHGFTSGSGGSNKHRLTTSRHF